MDRFLAQVVISFKYQTAYRFNVLLGSLSTILQIFVMVSVWWALDQAGALKASGGLGPYITYSVMAFSLGTTTVVFMVYTQITERIKKGDIGLDLIRPIGFQLNLLARYTGSNLFRLLFVMVPFIILAKVLLDIQLPSQALSWGIFTLSFIMAFLLQFATWFLFCLVGFISLENMGLLMTYNSLTQIFSGVMIPFWIYPDWLRGLAQVLPFQGIFSIPLNLWLERRTGWEAASDLLFQALWLGFLLALGAFLWRRILKHITVQGG